MKPVPFFLIPVILILLVGCHKTLDVEKNPIPGNTLVLEFVNPVKYSMELKIDGEVVPIKFSGKNRLLWVEGLSPGEHYFNIHSISYVFGPEFNDFTVDETRGAYFFIQSRKYRSALPKNRAQISIRAYRKKLKKEGVDINAVLPGKIRASFRRKN